MALNHAEIFEENTIVVCSGFVGEYSIIKSICKDLTTIRKATKQEYEKWNNRPYGNYDLL